MEVYSNSAAIIRTRKGNTVGCHLLVTKNYQKSNNQEFSYTNAYIGDSFDICETVGGNIVATVYDHLLFARVKVENRIQIQNVTEIEILSFHEV